MGHSLINGASTSYFMMCGIDAWQEIRENAQVFEPNPDLDRSDGASMFYAGNVRSGSIMMPVYVNSYWRPDEFFVDHRRQFPLKYNMKQWLEKNGNLKEGAK